MSNVSISRSSTYKPLTVDVDVDADLTDAFDARPGAIYGLVVPSDFDGTNILFHVSHDDVTYQPLYTALNVAVGMTVAASRSYDLPTELASWQYWKIETVTDQSTTDTVFIVVGKG
jgi:hypothetical protein